MQLPLGGIGITALDECLDQHAERERHPERYLVRCEQLECCPPVGFGRRHRPASQGHKSPTGRQEGDRQDRRLCPGAVEHLCEVGVGDLEGVGLDQPDRQVEREFETDEAGLLVAHEPAVGEHAFELGGRFMRGLAGSRTCAGETGEDQALAWSRPFEPGGVALQPPCRPGPSLEAGL